MSDVLDVAVIGKVNSGKSSFIRAYFVDLFGEAVNIRPPIDIVECTKEAEAFFHTGHPVRLWDMPGYGTNTVQADEYFRRYNLRKYHSYVLCSAGYSDFELALHNEIAKQGKRYCYVRTKIEMDMQNWKQSKNGTDAEWVVERGRMEQQLKTYFPDTPIFFIDNKKPMANDFHNLVPCVLEMAKFSVRSSESSRRSRSNRGRRRRMDRVASRPSSSATSTSNCRLM